MAVFKYQSHLFDEERNYTLDITALTYLGDFARGRKVHGFLKTWHVFWSSSLQKQTKSTKENIHPITLEPLKDYAFANEVEVH